MRSTNGASVGNVLAAEENASFAGRPCPPPNVKARSIGIVAGADETIPDLVTTGKVLDAMAQIECRGPSFYRKQSRCGGSKTVDMPRGQHFPDHKGRGVPGGSSWGHIDHNHLDTLQR